MSQTKAGMGLGWTSKNPVEPTAGCWDIPYPPDPRRYQVAPPPANNSEETRAELDELIVITHARTPDDIAQILKWSVNEPSLSTHWFALADEFCKSYQLSPPAGSRVHSLVNQAIYHSIIACWRNKYRYLRPRPSQLDPLVDVSVIPVPQHPSYPAGHSTAGGAAAAILSYVFPAERERSKALAQESGISRLKAGIHFRSDHTAGLKLGRRVAKGLLKAAANDGAPQQYTP